MRRGVRRFFRRLFCLHLNWVEPMTGISRPGRLVPPPDWRTDTRYWECTNCGKLKNFGFRGLPINFV